MLMSDKIGFKTKIVTSNKRGYLIRIKGPIHQGNITSINVYISNPKCMKQK